jgi:FAD/FMN-containing dehydrogenase
MPQSARHPVSAFARSGDTVEIDADTVADLARALTGELVDHEDASYDTERRVWNGMIDRHPALIARCASAEDVRTVLAFAREHDLALSVRGGGHNAAGAAVCDRGLVVDLALLDSIEVDAASRIVTAGGGVTIGALDAATQAEGLAVPLGLVTETGIAGLTLGGGLGWQRREHGLSCDNLVGAQVVTADGRIVHTSETENPELLWGLRGGGGNFGVVTTFEFTSHPIGPDVYFAVVMHPAADVPDALRFYRAWADTAPDAISSIAVTWHGPEMDEVPAEHHGEPIVVFAAVHSGSPREGEAALRSLREYGSPIADLSAVTPYLEVQQFFDEDYPKWEKRYYWTSAYVDDLSDDLVDELARLSAAAPSHESTIDIWHLGGAIARVAPDATAFGDRSAAFMLGIEANWEDRDDDDANIEWARQVVRASAPWSTGKRYANFPGLYESDEGPDFFGANEQRLASLKAEYDPENLFDRNHNVAPSTS